MASIPTVAPPISASRGLGASSRGFGTGHHFGSPRSDGPRCRRRRLDRAAGRTETGERFGYPRCGRLHISREPRENGAEGAYITGYFGDIGYERPCSGSRRPDSPRNATVRARRFGKNRCDSPDTSLGRQQDGSAAIDDGRCFGKYLSARPRTGRCFGQYRYGGGTTARPPPRTRSGARRTRRRPGNTLYRRPRNSRRLSTPAAPPSAPRRGPAWSAPRRRPDTPPSSPQHTRRA